MYSSIDSSRLFRLLVYISYSVQVLVSSVIMKLCQCMCGLLVQDCLCQVSCMLNVVDRKQGIRFIDVVSSIRLVQLFVLNSISSRNSWISLLFNYNVLVGMLCVFLCFRKVGIVLLLVVVYSILVYSSIQVSSVFSIEMIELVMIIVVFYLLMMVCSIQVIDGLGSLVSLVCDSMFIDSRLIRISSSQIFRKLIIVVWLMLVWCVVCCEQMLVFLMLMNIYMVISIMLCSCWLRLLSVGVLKKLVWNIFMWNVLVVSIRNSVMGSSLVIVIRLLMMVVVCRLCSISRWMVYNSMDEVVMVVGVLFLLKIGMKWFRLLKISMKKLVLFSIEVIQQFYVVEKLMQLLKFLCVYVQMLVFRFGWWLVRVWNMKVSISMLVLFSVQLISVVVGLVLCVMFCGNEKMLVLIIELIISVVNVGRLRCCDVVVIEIFSGLDVVSIFQLCVCEYGCKVGCVGIDMDNDQLGNDEGLGNSLGF